MNNLSICDALHDLVSFVQFKKPEKHTRTSVTFSTATLLKVTLLHGCFSHFLHCTNGTKSQQSVSYEVDGTKIDILTSFSLTFNLL